MKKFSLFLIISAFGIVACDLQPKIAALPDTVGDFISSRYPTLLADPASQPEIYNSAANDYGVYASPELYGSSDVDDYVLYSSVDDYIVPPQPQEEVEEVAVENVSGDDTNTQEFVSDDVLVVPEHRQVEPESKQDEINWDENTKTDDNLDVPEYRKENGDIITVVRGDTLYLLSKKYDTTVENLAKLNNLSEPYRLSVGQKLRIRGEVENIVKEEPKVEKQNPEPKPETKQQEPRKTTTRVDVDTIEVAPGDTLYSLSRKYSVPVNDLAVMNNLNAPFALYAGQKLKVPDLASAPVRVATPATKIAATNKTVKSNVKPETKKTVSKTEVKQGANTQKPAQQKDKTKQQATTKQKKSTSVPKTQAITARSSSKFTWPVRGKILSNYGAKTNGLFNDGINISAAAGTAVVAAENGVVAYAGNEVKGMGNLVIIQHSDGWMTVYAHMDSLGVRRGAHVHVGQKIGAVGKTGKVDKPQLHFEVRKGTKAYNPISYLKK